MSLQKRFNTTLRRDWPSYLIVFAVAALQIFLVTRPLDFLLTNVVPDDAFYYFQIARHIVSGNGPTFDGVELTNGFHPLWMLVLLPFFHFFSIGGISDLAPIHAALWFSVLCNFGTGYFVLRIISRFTNNQWIRAAGLGLFTLNPFFLFQSINGLETSLALLATSAFFLYAISFTDKASLRGHVLLGILGGIMILSRIDMVFYFAVFLSWRLLTDWKNLVRVRQVFLSGIVASLIVLPWFLWNFLTFGMLLTSAANGNSLVTHVLIVQDHGTSLLQLIKAVVYNFDYQVRLLFLNTGSPAFLAVLLGAAGTLIGVSRLRLPRRLSETTAVHALLLGFVLLFVVNVGIRFWARDWYFVTLGIFVALLFVVVAETLAPMIRYRKTVATLCALFVLYAFMVSWSKNLKDEAVAAREIYAAAMWSNEHLDPGTVTGAFNAGIQGYFSRARVVNLDGLVNNSAYEALRTRSTLAYIHKAGITYITDYDIYLTYRYRSFFGDEHYMDAFSLVTRLMKDAHTRSENGISVYQILPQP